MRWCMCVIGYLGVDGLSELLCFLRNYLDLRVCVFVCVCVCTFSFFDVCRSYKPSKYKVLSEKCPVSVSEIQTINYIDRPSRRYQYYTVSVLLCKNYNTSE